MRTSKVNHERFMRLALKLAQKAQGETNPNPLVGAVVVKNGKVIACGYHRKAGLAHAEVMALDRAGKAGRGGSLYVTLEPCCHYGRTAPCVDKILACGIKEVILAMRDPNPLNNGRGSQFLRRHGIKVLSGILEDEAKKINEVFIKYITQRLPFVTVKIAQSLDGKIATFSGDSRWISSKNARQYTHRLRSQVDAVLIGINTALKDDPLLTCRLNGHRYKKQPKKIIVDSKLRLSLKSKMFSHCSPGQIIVATTRFASPQKACRLQDAGAQIIVAKDNQGKVDLRDLGRKLAKQEIAHVLIEGGGEIVASALQSKLVDKIIVVIAPKIIGGRNAPTSVEGEGIKQLTQAIALEDVRFQRLGSEIMVEGRPRYVYGNY